MFSVVLLLTIGAVIATDYQEPPPIFEAAEYSSWKLRRSGNSRRGAVNVPFVNPQGESDSVDMYRLDLVGSAKERGFDHGALMSREIDTFMNKALPAYYESVLPGTVLDAVKENLPVTLQNALDKAVSGKLAAAAEQAMWWVYQKEEQYMPQEFIDEMESIAKGVCSTLPHLPGQACNVTEWDQKIKTVNMLPELVRMACTAFGAWGDANINNPSGQGGLVQVRALDFGTGPWVNYTVVASYRTTDNSAPSFAAVTWPGFVGAVTGINEVGVGISEKVWMVNGKKNIQPGRYDGIPDAFTLRYVLQHSASKEDAEKFAQDSKRTWAMFMGLGDFASQKFDLVAYRMQDANVYDDTNIHEITSMPVLKDVAYVDKHPQPSDDPSLPQALSDFYGNITMENARVITQYHKTGDVHIAVYDYSAREMLVSIGRVNKEGQYMPEGGTQKDVWEAHNRPFLRFNLNDLFQGK